MDRYTLDNLAGNVVGIYNQMENDMLINIASKLKGKTDLLNTDPVTWRIQQLETLGLLTKENIKVIRDNAGLTSSELNKMLFNAGLQGVNEIDQDVEKATKKGAQLVKPVPINESPQMLNILGAYQSQAVSVLNLTNQTMIDQSKKIHIDIINKASGYVSGGLKTGEQALRQVVTEWAENGIPALVDKAGRKWGVEGYVRTVLVSTTNNTVNEMQDQRFNEFNIDLVEISSHAGNRKGCQPYAGRIFSLKPDHPKYPYLYDPSVGRIGDPDSLFGINCGHRKYAFIEGVSEQRFTPENKAEGEIIYAESQQQRAIERSIRKAKTQYEMFKAMDDKDGMVKAKALISLRQKNMREFIQETGRTRRSAREQIYTNKKPPAPLPELKKDVKKVIKKIKDDQSIPTPDIKKPENNEIITKKKDVIPDVPKIDPKKIKIGDTVKFTNQLTGTKDGIVKNIYDKTNTLEVSVAGDFGTEYTKISNVIEHNPMKASKIDPAGIDQLELTVHQMTKIDLTHKEFESGKDFFLKSNSFTQEYKDDFMKRYNAGEFKNNPLEIDHAEGEVLVYEKHGNMWIAKSKTLGKEVSKENVDCAIEWINNGMVAKEHTDGLLIKLTDKLDGTAAADYKYAKDRLSLSPYLGLETGDLDYIADRTKVFHDLFYHELGHRIHEVPGEKLMVTAEDYKKLGINNTITKDQWKDWKAETNKFYSAKYKAFSDFQRFNYPFNSRTVYADKSKEHYYQEMFAETTSVYLDRVPEEYAKMEKHFPGLLEKMEGMLKKGFFKDGQIVSDVNLSK